MNAASENQILSVCFNSNELENDQPITISPLACIRYSNDAESKVIDDYMDKLVSSDLFTNNFPLLGVTSIKPDGGGETFVRSAPPRRYVLLESKDSEVSQRNQTLIQIASHPLEFGFNFRVREDGGRHRNYQTDKLFRLGNPSENHLTRPLQAVSKAHGEHYSELWNQTTGWPPAEWTRPSALMSLYSQAKQLSTRSPFTFLALTSIIEGVLVHKPKSSDPTESISRQIKRKIPLLNRRAKFPVDPATFFLLANDEKATDRLWNGLYDLRSEVAHGDTMTFKKFDTNRKLLVELKDLQTCINFVDAIARMLLRQMCAEPQLVFELRDV